MSADEKVATFVRRLTGWTGDARLYKLNPALDGYEYVIVSAVATYGITETYIFPADGESGEVASWGELEGSYRGGLDHAEALRGAGYSAMI